MAVDELSVRYADELEQLLPPGSLFRSPVGPNIRALLEALAVEFARVHGRVEQLLAEQAPRSTSELLSDWERVLGLPDGCTNPSSATNIRRASVLGRIAVPGGQSRAAFIALGAALGFPISIEEHKTFRVGSRVGDRVYNVEGGWPWTFTVHAPVATAHFFRAGSSGSGDALATFDNSPLECAIARVKPAHAHVLFAYDQQVHPADYQPWGWYVVPEPIVVRTRFPRYTLEL